MRIRILIADGNETIRHELKTLIIQEGYEVDVVPDGITAIKHFRRYDYNLVILEVQLPELDGKNVCRQIRKMDDIPIVLLSNDGDEAAVLEGYSLGAEEYIVKPFSKKELMARIKVILRRNLKEDREKLPIKRLSFDGLHIDTVSHSVYVNDKMVPLTPKEYQLLLYLAKNPNKAFSREMLLNEIWGQDYYGTDRTVDTHVKTLREAIKPHEYYIATVRGIGYSFKEIHELLPK